MDSISEGRSERIAIFIIIILKKFFKVNAFI